MAKNPTLGELARNWKGYSPAKLPKYEWIRVLAEREEDPETVDLTAEEVQAILAAIIVVDDFQVAERLETTKYQATHFLSEAYTKLKGD